MTKKSHACKRALLRYELKLTQDDLDNIVKLIQNGKAQFIERSSNRRTIFNVNYNNKVVTIVYNSEKHKVITFLPINSREILRHINVSKDI